MVHRHLNPYRVHPLPFLTSDGGEEWGSQKGDEGGYTRLTGLVPYVQYIIMVYHYASYEIHLTFSQYLTHTLAMLV
jgi:hypothetical protein